MLPVSPHPIFGSPHIFYTRGQEVVIHGYITFLLEAYAYELECLFISSFANGTKRKRLQMRSGRSLDAVSPILGNAELFSSSPSAVSPVRCTILHNRCLTIHSPPRDCLSSVPFCKGGDEVRLRLDAYTAPGPTPQLEEPGEPRNCPHPRDSDLESAGRGPLWCSVGSARSSHRFWASSCGLAASGHL